MVILLKYPTLLRTKVSGRHILEVDYIHIDIYMPLGTEYKIHMIIRETPDSLNHIHVFLLCIRNHILPIWVICFHSFEHRASIVYLVR